MNEIVYKEILFDKYCPICKYCDLAENEEPCDRCLEETVNAYSHRPLEWKEKE